MRLFWSGLLLGLLLSVAVPPAIATPQPVLVANEGEGMLEQGFRLMQQERLGTLRLNMTEVEVAQQMRCPVVRGKDEFWGAIGEYVQGWRYPNCGVFVRMRSAQAGGKKDIFSMSITRPSKLKTRRGIGIGSPAADVMKAYRDFYNPSDSQPGKTIVAGTVYGGVIFFLENGRVSEIFIGAAAE